MIFESGCTEYRIITEGKNFLDFVKEKYIVNQIISEKKKRNIKSLQLITDTPYARTVIKSDIKQNRISKLLPSRYTIAFTEIITDKFVVFISPRMDNLIFITENENFAETRKSLFNIMWEVASDPTE